MKKLFLLTKTLLVMTLLCVGANAWADATVAFSQNFTGESTAPTDYGFTKTAETAQDGQSATVTDGKFQLVCGGYGNALRGYLYTASFSSVGAGNTVTFSCTWNIGNATGNNQSYSRIALTDGTNNVLELTYYGVNKVLYVNGSEAATNVAREQTLAVTATINLDTKKITALSVGSVYTAAEAFDFMSSSATSISSFVFAHYIRANWTCTSYIDNVSITYEANQASYADVTFKYADTAGNSLSAYKADVVESVEVGSTIASNISSALTSTFNNGTSNKYIYADSYTVTGDYTTVQAGGNTVTLKFTDYPSTAYTVKAQLSGVDLTTLESSSTFFDGSYSAYWSKYIKVGDQWYEPNEATYGKVITSATNNVAFKTTDSKSIFIEAEDMTLSRSYGDPTNNVEYSGGAGRAPYGGATLDSKTKIPAGKYTITIGTKTRNNSKTQSYKVSYSTDGSAYTEVGTISYTTSSGFHENSTDVEIPATAYIRLTEGQGGNAQDYVDYVYFVQTGVAATISSYGKSTFSSTYPLDCANLPSGLKAYKATAADASKVTMVEVTDAVEGMTGSNKTGLVLVGTPSTTYYIPIATTDGSEPSGNLLFGWDSSWGNLGVAGSGTNFVLSVQDENVVWAPILDEENTAPLATGQAGLWANVTIGSGSARALRMVFPGDVITGVESVEAAAEAAEKDGKFVENGMLVIKKNGKKFNAAGQQVK